MADNKSVDDTTVVTVVGKNTTNGLSVVLPILPAEFWESRVVLSHIRQAARSRRRSPDVVFHTVLARLAAYTSHLITVQTGIGNPRGASLNYFVGLIARSGRGKSSGASIAGSLISRPKVPVMKISGEQIYTELDCQEGPIGSGEGLCESYMGFEFEEVDSGRERADGSPILKREKYKAQVRHNSFVQIDEGQILEQIGSRKGATIGPIMRSAWTCDELGQQNANKETSRIIPSGSYALGLVAGFQFETVMPVLGDYNSGMAQRFVWCSTFDRDVPAVKPEWPGKIEIESSVLVVNEPTEMTLPISIMEKLDEEAIDTLNPLSEDSNEYDAHKPLTLIKIAGLLALLEGRHKITENDWELAGVVWKTSCGVRDSILKYVVRLEDGKNARRDAQYVSREMTLHNAKIEIDAKVVAIATRISNKVRLDPEINTLAKARRTLRGGENGEREYFEAALSYAESKEWIVVEDTKISCGGSQPGGRS